MFSSRGSAGVLGGVLVVVYTGAVCGGAVSMDAVAVAMVVVEMSLVL